MIDILKNYWLELIDHSKIIYRLDRISELIKLQEINKQDEILSNDINVHIEHGFFYNCRHYRKSNSQLVNNTAKIFWLNTCAICSLKYLLVYRNEKINPLEYNDYSKTIPNEAIEIYKLKYAAFFEYFNLYIYNIKNSILTILLKHIYKLTPFERISNISMGKEEQYISKFILKDSPTQYSLKDLIILSNESSTKKYIALSNFFNFDVKKEIFEHSCNEEKCLKCYVKYMMSNYVSYVYENDPFYDGITGAMEVPEQISIVLDRLKIDWQIFKCWETLVFNFINDIMNNIYNNKFNKSATLDNLITLGYDPKEDIERDKLRAAAYDKFWDSL